MHAGVQNKHLHAVWHVHIDHSADALEVNAPDHPKLCITFGPLPLPLLLLLLLVLATLMPPLLVADRLLTGVPSGLLPVSQAGCLLGALCRVICGNEVVEDAFIELLQSTDENSYISIYTYWPAQAGTGPLTYNEATNHQMSERRIRNISPPFTLPVVGTCADLI